MPKPTQNETQEQFIDRCMSDAEVVSDFPDNDQRLAFCHSQWEDAQKAKLAFKKYVQKTKSLRNQTLIKK